MELPIDDQTNLADSPPEEAAKNINNANVFGMNASDYKDNSKELDKEVEKLRAPATAEAPVQEYMAQSSEHTALASQDSDVLDYLSRQAKLIGDYIFDRPSNERKIVDLNLKKMNKPDSFTEDDEVQLHILNKEREAMAKRNYGLDGPFEQLPAQVAGSVADMAGSVVRGGLQGLQDYRPKSLPGMALAAVTGYTKDQFNTLAGSTYNELSNLSNDKGEPLNIDDSTKKNIAYGVAMVGTGAQAVLGATLARTTPFLQKFASPMLAKQVVLSPANAALKQTLVNIGEAALVGGGTSGFTEVAKIVGEEIGKTYDGTEASFLNGLMNAAKRADEYKGRVGSAVLVGGATAGAIATGTGALGFGATKSQFETEQNAKVAQARDVTPRPVAELPEPPNPDKPIDVGQPVDGSPGSPLDQSVKVVQLKTALENMNKAAKSTKMVDLAPQELGSVKQKIFDSAGIKKFYVTVDDLRKWATDEKRGEAARNIIDPSGVAASQMNAPIGVKPHEFMEVARTYPDLLDILRYEPDGPTPLQAEQFLKNHEDAHNQRQFILNELGLKPQELQPKEPSNVIELPGKRAEPLTNEDVNQLVVRADQILKQQATAEGDQKKALDQELQDIKEKIKNKYQLGEPGKLLVADFGLSNEEAANRAKSSYLEAPTFTKAIESVLPEAEVKKFNDAQMAARKEISDSIDDAAKYEMNKVIDVNNEIAKETQYEIEAQRTEFHPNLDIVDKFRRTVVADSKGKNKTSVYAIDPRTLTEEQAKYASSPLLKEHKVFAPNGQSADEAARLIGVRDGEELLKILSSTPTREQVINARVKANMANLEAQVRDNVDLNHTSILKAYNNKSLNHIREMKFMREQNWPATKSGIKRIALPLPRIEELRLKAVNGIKQTKVGDLNPRQYIVGERQSQRVAVNAILKNEVEKAFVAKENAALNSEFTRESYLAIGRVNRILRFAKKLDDPSNIRALKDAGRWEAAKEILDVFNLNPRYKDQAILGSYRKWVKKMFDAGIGNFEIPERLSDVRQNVNDMTVEQLELVGQRLRELLFSAKEENKLFNEFKKEVMLQTTEALEEAVHKELVDHPDYNPARVPSVQEPKAPEKVKRFFSTTASLVNGFKHIAFALDKEKPLGFFYELLVEPLTGEGKYKNKQGFSGDVEDRIHLLKFLNDTIEKTIGRDEYNTLRNNWLEIPEFKDLQNYNYGKLLKGDLMILMGHLGDPDGRRNVENMGAPLNVVQRVLERELTEKHADFMNLFMHRGVEAYWDRTIALQKKTTGEDVTFIKGVPWKFKEKEYPGGYMRQRYRSNFDDEQLKRAQADLEAKNSAIYGDTDNKIYARQYAAEMTDQGRLEERTGSDKPLDLAFGQILVNYEEIIHDLNYREPIINALKVLRNPKIKADIVSTVGIDKYRVMTNSVIEVANQVTADDNNYFSDQTRLAKDLTGHLRSGFSLTRIGANLVSMAVQPASILVNTFPKMGGLNGPKHLSNVIRKILTNPTLLPGMYEFAQSLDSSLKAGHHEIADSITSTFYNALPSKNLFPKLGWINVAKDWVNHNAMSIIQLADDASKTMMALALYEQFMAGDAEGYSLADVQKMTPEKAHELATKYVAQITETTLTRSNKALDKSYFEKSPYFSTLNYFFNDARQTLNNFGAQGRKTKWGAKETYQKAKAGDTKGAKEAAMGTAGVVMTFLVYTAIARLYEDKLRGQKTPFDYPDQFNLHTVEGQKKAADAFGKWFILAPFDVGATVTPVAREIHFAADVSNQRKAKKEVSTPLTTIMTAVATAYSAISDILSGDRQEMNKQQIQQTLYATSYLVGGMPINGPQKLMKYMKQNEEVLGEKNPPPPQEGIIDRLKDEIKKYLSDPPKGAREEFLNQLKQFDAQLDQKTATPPKEASDVVKIAASGGDWSKIGPGSQAGLYQFSKERWQEIMQKAPEIGLTENGRVSKNPLEQELAFQWSSQQDAQALHAQDIPIDNVSIYGSHLLGVENYIKITKAPADTKLKTVIGTLPQAEDLKTVGQLRKLIQERVDKGLRQLTKTASTTED